MEIAVTDTSETRGCCLEFGLEKESSGIMHEEEYQLGKLNFFFPLIFDEWQKCINETPVVHKNYGIQISILGVIRSSSQMFPFPSGIICL